MCTFFVVAAMAFGIAMFSQPVDPREEVVGRGDRPPVLSAQPAIYDPVSAIDVLTSACEATGQPAETPTPSTQRSEEQP